MKTLLLSAVTRQFLIQGAGFADAHPNDWLIWEAGQLQLPKGNIATAATVHEGLDLAAALPRVGDPLCFLLAPKHPGGRITIGRAEGNDVVLSDHTVSRHHCTLVWRDHGWSATAADESVSFQVDGSWVPHGRSVELSSGQILTLGNLTLSFYTAQGMAQRLASKLKRL